MFHAVPGHVDSRVDQVVYVAGCGDRRVAGKHTKIDVWNGRPKYDLHDVAELYLVCGRLDKLGSSR